MRGPQQTVAESFGVSPLASALSNGVGMNAALAVAMLTGGNVAYNLPGITQLAGGDANSILKTYSDVGLYSGSGVVYQGPSSASTAKPLLMNANAFSNSVVVTSITAVHRVIANLLDVTVVAPAHGLAVGQYALIKRDTSNQFNGVHRVATVADANTFTFEMYTGAATVSAATGTTIICCRADANIIVQGGTWDLNKNTNAAGNGLMGMIFNKVGNLQVRQINLRNTVKYGIYYTNCWRPTFKDINSIGDCAIQAIGPIQDTVIDTITGESSDDPVAVVVDNGDAYIAYDLLDTPTLGTATSSSAVVTVASTAIFFNGQAVHVKRVDTGAEVYSANTVISSISAGVSLTLSAPSTYSGAVNVYPVNCGAGSVAQTGDVTNYTVNNVDIDTNSTRIIEIGGGPSGKIQGVRINGIKSRSFNSACVDIGSAPTSISANGTVIEDIEITGLSGPLGYGQHAVVITSGLAVAGTGQSNTVVLMTNTAAFTNGQAVNVKRVDTAADVVAVGTTVSSISAGVSITLSASLSYSGAVNVYPQGFSSIKKLSIDKWNFSRPAVKSDGTVLTGPTGNIFNLNPGLGWTINAVDVRGGYWEPDQTNAPANVGVISHYGDIIKASVSDTQIFGTGNAKTVTGLLALSGPNTSTVCHGNVSGLHLSTASGNFLSHSSGNATNHHTVRDCTSLGAVATWVGASKACRLQISGCRSFGSTGGNVLINLTAGGVSTELWMTDLDAGNNPLVTANFTSGTINIQAKGLRNFNGDTFLSYGTTNTLNIRSADTSLTGDSSKFANISGATMTGTVGLIGPLINDGVAWKRNGSKQQTVTFSATPALDCGLGNVVTLSTTLTAGITWGAPTNVPAAGETVFVTMTQDGTGGRSVAWNAAYIFPTAWTNTGNTSGLTSSVLFVSDGVKLVAKGVNLWA